MLDAWRGWVAHRRQESDVIVMMEWLIWDKYRTFSTFVLFPTTTTTMATVCPTSTATTPSSSSLSPSSASTTRDPHDFSHVTSKFCMLLHFQLNRTFELSPRLCEAFDIPTYKLEIHVQSTKLCSPTVSGRRCSAPATPCRSCSEAWSIRGQDMIIFRLIFGSLQTSKWYHNQWQRS